MLSSSGGERRNAFAALERTMQSANVSWTDIGDGYEHGGDNGKFTESEMQEYGQAMRTEGVDAGILVGLARASNGNGNGSGHLTLPSPFEMADYCHDRLSRLKDDKQRNFVSDMFLIMGRGNKNLSLGRLGYLASIYIQIGGKV